MSQLAPDTLEEDQVALGEITGSLGFLLRMAQLKAFDFFFQTIAGAALKPGEFTVLWVIGLNPGLRQGSIARRLHIKPAHMTKLVQRLVGAGYVTRTIPEDDRRSVRLALTAAGEAFVERHRGAFLHAHLAERSALSEAEAEQFVTLLRKYAELDETRT